MTGSVISIGTEIWGLPWVQITLRLLDAIFFVMVTGQAGSVAA